jgi:NAD(P)-dependent dehydrogenase (short-subunit alcohol dehydrogenase family)
MTNQLNRPIVLITGALTGIGRATALAFAQEGARVVVSGRHNDEGQKLAAELHRIGTEAEFVRTDVRYEEEVKDLVDRTIARFGRLDIAVNNAGTVGNPGSAADVTVEAYQSIFDTNVLGVLLCMKYEIRAMLQQGKGSIVNISSAYGKECSTTLPKRRRTKQISSKHKFLTNASALPKKLPMPSYSSALTRRPISLAHPWQSTEE